MQNWYLKSGMTHPQACHWSIHCDALGSEYTCCFLVCACSQYNWRHSSACVAQLHASLLNLQLARGQRGRWRCARVRAYVPTAVCEERDASLQISGGAPFSPPHCAAKTCIWCPPSIAMRTAGTFGSIVTLAAGTLLLEALHDQFQPECFASTTPVHLVSGVFYYNLHINCKIFEKSVNNA